MSPLRAAQRCPAGSLAPTPVGASKALRPSLRSLTALRVITCSFFRHVPSRSKRMAAAVLAVVFLTGCGPNFHPGDAAVVNGQAIRANQVDDLVLAACDYSAQNRVSQNGTLPTQSTANLRLAITQALIQFQLIDQVAHQQGLSVSDARIAQLMGGSPIPSGVSGQHRQLLAQFLRDSAKAQLQQAVIGAHLHHPNITTDAKVSKTDIPLATQYLNKFFAKQSVIVDPGFGKWTGTKLVPSSGSLSYPVSTTPQPGQSTPDLQSLPASQVCG